MKAFILKHKKILIIAAAVLLAAGGAFGGWGYWRYCQPKFQDVTVELGVASLGLDSFTTEYARLSKCAFVSDVASLDIGKAGSYSVTLRHGKQEQTVSLNVVDTVPPKVEFIPERHEVSGYMPKPEDFVKNLEDFSPVTVTFAQQIPEDWTMEPKTLTVVVTDAGGNELRQDCTLTYTWLQENVSLELGQPLTREDVLLNPEKDAAMISQTMLDTFSSVGVGEFSLTTRSGDARQTCRVTVADTKGPALELQNVSVYRGTSVDVEDFVASAVDPSGVAQVRLLTELDVKTVGEQTVTIEAEDALGNITTATALLRVGMDMEPPVIRGLYTLKVEKGGTPDYYYGVTAQDEKDGYCRVRCSFENVDTSKAGYYYVTYTATDTSGNTATARRKVEVLHDAADTTALVNEIAASLSSDPEALRDYVRGTISYSTDWGGDDPVWYGFNQRSGNCYVHALCLQRLLSYYGYETKLIWVTNKTHYWLVINLGGVWRHIDPTPSNTHSRYSLMTDEMRYETLRGRDWDREKWPACE